MAALPRHLILIFLVLAGGIICAAEDPLPQRDKDAPLDFEPNLSLYDVEPGVVPLGEAEPDLGRAETRLEKAKRKEQRWQQLQRAGVLSKVEVERAERQANDAALKLALARVAHWKLQVESLRTRVAKGETSREMLQTAEASLRNAERLAGETDALFRQRELEIAKANVERQQRLLTLGAGSRTQVSRAAEMLEKLKAPSHTVQSSAQ